MAPPARWTPAGPAWDGETPTLCTLAVILLIAWLLGIVGTYTIGAFVHVLLVVAIVLFLVGLLAAVVHSPSTRLFTRQVGLAGPCGAPAARLDERRASHTPGNRGELARVRVLPATTSAYQGGFQ